MLKRVTDEGSLSEIAQYSPYYLPLNVFTASKGSLYKGPLYFIVQSHKKARHFTFRMLEVDALYYQVSKNKDTHQLCSYSTTLPLILQMFLFMILFLMPPAQDKQYKQHIISTNGKYTSYDC